MATGVDIIDQYLTHLRITLNRSPKTVEQYGTDLMLFFRFLLCRRDGIAPTAEAFAAADLRRIDLAFVGAVTTADIYEFLMYTASERNNQPKARARKLSSIKGFYRYLTTTVHRLEQNPAIDISSPTIKPSLPKYLSVEESVNLLETIQNDPECRSRERDYAIVTLFLNCGMRLSELVGINLGDLDSELRSVRVLGKGAKERVIYLNDACRFALKDYLRVRAQDTEVKDPNALFLSRLHRRISNKTVQWLVYKYLGEAGLSYKHYSTHKLRHTAATLMYQTGEVDVRVLKDILGHEQLNTTQIYTHVSDAHMENAMQMNPLSGIKRKKAPAPESKTETDDNHDEKDS